MSNNKQSSNHLPDVGNKVSSVEFIKNNLERLGMLDNGKVITNIFEQAEAMHRIEIIESYASGSNDRLRNTINTNYYNETFGGNK